MWRIVQALDGGISRIKLDAGTLSAAQAEAVADAAERFAGGVIEVTNRPHTARAYWTFQNCTGLDVQMAPIGRVDWAGFPVQMVREAAGFVRNGLRGCPG